MRHMRPVQPSLSCTHETSESATMRPMHAFSQCAMSSEGALTPRKLIVQTDNGRDRAQCMLSRSCRLLERTAHLPASSALFSQDCTGAQRFAGCKMDHLHRGDPTSCLSLSRRLSSVAIPWNRTTCRRRNLPGATSLRGTRYGAWAQGIPQTHMLQTHDARCPGPFSLTPTSHRRYSGLTESSHSPRRPLGGE